jgi:hypothetical protein
MKTQEFVTGEMTLSLFLASRRGDADTSSQTACPVAPHRSRFADALKLRRSLLLLLLCRRKPQHRRPSRQELTLPRGCVFVVRYSSR